MPSAAAIIVGSLMATPALAQASMSIPEPSAAVLLGLGVAGLLIGRRVARRPSDD